MCGITAIVTLAGRHGPIHKSNLSPEAPSTDQQMTNGLLTDGSLVQDGIKGSSVEDQLSQSLDSIHHRGPDSHGTWFSLDQNIGRY